MTLYVSGMLISAFALRGLIFGFAVTAGLAERWLDPDSPERQMMVSASVWTIALCLALGRAGRPPSEAAASTTAAAPRGRRRPGLRRKR